MEEDRPLRYLLTLLAAIVLFPIYITVVNSLLAPSEITSQPPKFFPTDPQWSNVLRRLEHRPHGAVPEEQLHRDHRDHRRARWSPPSSPATPSPSSTSRSSAPLFVVFLATLMVPFEVTIVTNVTTIADLGWSNSYQGLRGAVPGHRVRRLPHAAAFLTLPNDLRDAAALDGYGHWRFMMRVAVPLARPAVAALSVFAFLGAWNQYLWPLLVTKDDEFRTVQIGLKQPQGLSIDQINVTFAGAVIAVLPLVILLLAFQKQLVRGLTAGAVKG